MRRFEVSVRTRWQLQAVEQCADNIKRCYIHSELLQAEEAAPLVSTVLCELQKQGVELYAALPYMMREENGAPDEQDLYDLCEKLIRKCNQSGEIIGNPTNQSGKTNENVAGCPQLEGMLVRNLEQLAFLADHDYWGNIVLDSQIYIWNAQALNELFSDEYLAGRIVGFTLPLEESMHQWKQTCSSLNGEIKPGMILYGRVPMMVSAGCVLRTTENCSKEKGRFHTECLELQDRTNRKLPVECSCRYCYNVIWNAYPLSLHNAYGKGLPVENASYRLDFTTETQTEMLQIVDFFVNGQGETLKPPYANYTTGRFQKGVD